MSWYLYVLKKYAVFSGRARRKEYWMFTLVNYIIMAVPALIAEHLLPLELVGVVYIALGVYFLVIVLPSIAVAVRRLHDGGRSGWWFFITFLPILGGLIFLIFMVIGGDKGSNQFGEDPKEGS